MEQHVVNWRNRSWSLTAMIGVSDSGADGVLINLGGHGGGWAFYLKNGAPTFCYNLFGLDHTYVRGDSPVPAGQHQVRVEFAYDGGGLGRGGTVTLFTDGVQTATGRIDKTEPLGFGSEYTDVGRDSLSPVTDDYPAGDNTFTGTIEWIEMEAGGDSHDHLVDPESIVQAAMYRQ